MMNYANQTAAAYHQHQPQAYQTANYSYQAPRIPVQQLPAVGHSQTANPYPTPPSTLHVQTNSHATDKATHQLSSPSSHGIYVTVLITLYYSQLITQDILGYKFN